MKIYYMKRNVDVTGTSGTGLVAEVVVFNNGKAVVSWNGGFNAIGVSSTVVYDSLDDVIKVHGHDGNTELVSVGEFLRADDVRAISL
jgi:hypothetical protein